VVAGAVGTSLFSRPNDPRLVAQADLEPFPNWDASGSARVEEETSGARHIVVDLSAPNDGLTEVWLIDPDTSGLISLGLLSGREGRFALPEDLDLARYSVVDVSLEPDDGNPAHSGDSIVRGELQS
jgi:anti-sigma-K factor RskA